LPWQNAVVSRPPDSPGPLNRSGIYYAELVDDKYLWIPEMEWRSLADVRAFRAPGHWMPGFYSFAFSGGGDDWCWYPAATAGAGRPCSSARK
jgi:hypothetical protein